MNRRTWRFVVAALACSLALGAFVAPFASPSPDALEKFAQDQRLVGQAEGKGVWTHAPLSDYKVRGVRNESVSTGIAGVVGTLAVFGLAFGLARVIARRKTREP
ncbi:MAG: PDGLE domain-containing protein [Planctomycetota bacterium]|nr:PDGLE domain-containing protein [Planctomycetota bacterium]